NCAKVMALKGRENHRQEACATALATPPYAAVRSTASRDSATLLSTRSHREPLRATETARQSSHSFLPEEEVPLRENRAGSDAGALQIHGGRVPDLGGRDKSLERAGGRMPAARACRLRGEKSTYKSPSHRKTLPANWQRPSRPRLIGCRGTGPAAVQPRTESPGWQSARFSCPPAWPCGETGHPGADAQPLPLLWLLETWSAPFRLTRACRVTSLAKRWY